MHVTFERQCAACQVQVLVGDEWRTVLQIEDGTDRRTVRDFSPVKTDRLRLLCDKPSPSAAVCEMRVYCE